MKYYAVVDTNVLVSALLSSKSDTATVLVFNKIILGDVIPLYSNKTMKEYREVLARRKFKFDSVSEYSGDVSVFVHIDIFCRRLFRKPRHCHYIAG